MSRTPYSAFVVKIMKVNPTNEVGDGREALGGAGAVIHV